LLKLFIFKLPNFEFLPYPIVLFGRYNFKGIILSLIALLGIPIRLGPLRWVILYKVLFYVLPGYVFGAGLIIRNPLYCGKIVVPQYRDEEARLVNGQHDAIISEALFYRVQDVLDSKSRTYRPKIKTIENFPLRGFFMCPKCGQKLTGSKCKGRNKYYYYYHCDKVCKWRINSEIANKTFKVHLNKFKPLPEVKKLYSAVLLEGYREHTGLIINEKKKSLEQIAVYEKKLTVARNLLVTEKIDAEDYHLMKIEYNAVISKIEKEIANVDDDRENIEYLTNTGLENLLKLGDAFDGGTLADSREIIGLIFPENFTFSDNKIRTTRVNEIINCILSFNGTRKLV
jgi:site-specific DNA recombinase